MITTKFEDMNYGFGDMATSTNEYVPGLQILQDNFPDWENADYS